MRVSVRACRLCVVVGGFFCAVEELEFIRSGKYASWQSTKKILVNTT